MLSYPAEHTVVGVKFVKKLSEPDKHRIELKAAD
jgi:hypothetical protein